MPAPRPRRGRADAGAWPRPAPEAGAQTRLQTKPVQASGTPPSEAPAGVREVLRSPGEPLDTATSAFYEPRFGRDFSDVRVHTDARAARSAQTINAAAYTFRNHIVFGTDRYRPETSAGRRLLAHELTHVVQQASVPEARASLQRVADKSDPPSTLPCGIDTGAGAPGGPGGTYVLFRPGGGTVDAEDTELIAAEFAAWEARGRSDTITIDGFASSDGPAAVNWGFSCDRAEAVKAEFIRLGVPAASVTTTAHGETEEFSATDPRQNRRAVIRIVPAAASTQAAACPDSVTENTTLTADCSQGIAIAADNVVLDCGGHTVTGPGTGNGIEVRGHTGVRVVNCNVTNFDVGFRLRDSNANTFTYNTSVRNRVDGFDLDDSNDNIFIQNHASENGDHGVELDGSSGNLFIGNVAAGNGGRRDNTGDGFDTEGPPRGGRPAPRNNFVRNQAHANRRSGFRILSDDNTLRDNTSRNNDRDGFRIEGDTNTLSGNDASNNTRDGFRIEGDDNTLTGNFGNGNRSNDADVRNNTAGNACTGNTFGGTNGQCPPDFP